MAKLTERENEILQMVLEEVSTASIAQKLNISKRTVDAHRRNIVKKAGTNNLIGLYKYALKTKLIKHETINNL